MSEITPPAATTGSQPVATGPQPVPSRNLLVRWYRRRKRKRSLLWRFRRLLFLGLLLVVSAMAGAGMALSQIELPPDDESFLETSFICTSEVTENCNADNATATLNGEEDRTVVAYEQIPQVMVNAVVAAEDQNFFTHQGIDPVGIARAAWADINNRAIEQGGSTITQQLVKSVFLTNERSLVRKIREAVLAVKLERESSKEEILERYLNTIYFGRGAYGVQAAARAYFGKDVEDLNLADASYLAGLVRSPEGADAQRDPEEASRRRETVLVNMASEGYITQQRRDRVAAKEWDINPFGAGNLLPRSEARVFGNVRGASYGTEYFIEYVRQQLLALDQFDEGEVYGGGLRIYTTLNHEFQRAAYETVTNTLDQPDDPKASIVTIGSKGRVRAMMGGDNFTDSEVNLATGADGGGSGRQPGSAFKPYAMAEALAQGFTAQATLPAPRSISLDIGNGREWNVSGGGSSSGTHNMLTGTRASSNVFYAQLMLEVGPANVVDMATQLGVTAELPEVPSIVLGAGEVSVLDMASAFTTFRNHGEQHEPVVIERVEDSEGNVRYEADLEGNRVITGQIADTVTTALKDVVSGGTGTASRIDAPSAGKTGTTQNNKDAWFVGYTCDVTTAVWMGFVGTPTEPVRSMTSVHGRTVFGGSFPAEMWRDYMSVVNPRVQSDCELAEVTDFPGQQFGKDASDLFIPPVVVTTTAPEGSSPDTTSPTTSPPTTSPPTTSPPTTGPP